MTAAYELRRAGYRVQVLEYNARPGGRNWTRARRRRLCRARRRAPSLPLRRRPISQPGPVAHSRITITRVLDYCRRFGVALEPFVQLNHNAYFHKPDAFGGAPQRIREIKADFDGGVAELLAKATRKGALDEEVTKEDREILLEALARPRRARSRLSLPRRPDRLRCSRLQARRRAAASRRGLRMASRSASAKFSPRGCGAGLQSFLTYDFQTTMFQPVGGMGRIGEAFGARTRRRDPLQRQGRRDRAGRARRRGALRGSAAGGAAASGARGLVRLHAAAQHPEPNGRFRSARRCARRSRARALCAGGEGRAAVLPPLLGGGRAHLRRHILHRSADPPDRLSQLRLQPRRQGRAARRLSVRRRRTPTNSPR